VSMGCTSPQRSCHTRLLGASPSPDQKKARALPRGTYGPYAAFAVATSPPSCDGSHQEEEA